MTQKIRMWEVTKDDTLTELQSIEIRLEDQLEEWLESDISILDDDLLIIGRQVRTEYNGVIDLLCLDNSGNTVVVELKKGKTKPREVTSQALDYSSWVKDLGLKEITAIASRYGKMDGSLEEEFEAKFDQQLPDELNLSHSALIVAEEIDADTERIVRYLSDWGVPINVATVQHFRDSNGRELLAQVFLIEPEEVEVKADSRSKGRRLPNTAMMAALANEKGVGELYNYLTSELSGILNTASFGKESRGFRVKDPLVKDGVKWLAVLVVELGESNQQDGLVFRLNGTRLMRVFGLSDEQLGEMLPLTVIDMDPSNWRKAPQEEIDNWKGYRCSFCSKEEVDKFIAGLREGSE